MYKRQDVQLLLDYGFTAYKEEILIAAGQIIKMVQVEKGVQQQGTATADSNFYYPLAADELSDVCLLYTSRCV